jgi:hypothetical protein
LLTPYFDLSNLDVVCSKLLSIGEDSILNVYDIGTNSDGRVKNLYNTAKIDLSSECYAIASNSVDKVVIGGEENKVDLHTLTSSATFN